MRAETAVNVSAAEMRRILALERDERAAALLRCLYAAGMRSSEAETLRKADLLPRRSALSVYRDGRVRVVVLAPETFAAIARAAPAEPDARIFPIGARQIYRVVARAGGRAGVPGVTPRALRRAHAAHALEKGCPAHVVRATIGVRSAHVAGDKRKARPNESSALYLPV